jgi:hypothetical protein
MSISDFGAMALRNEIHQPDFARESRLFDCGSFIFLVRGIDAVRALIRLGSVTIFAMVGLSGALALRPDASLFIPARL